jgi:hypothetical protein|tara:strand:- start:1248 stop:1373 length:126 start_codon:yes stop_codon:yes gene_type:complete
MKDNFNNKKDNNKRGLSQGKFGSLGSKNKDLSNSMQVQEKE